MQKTFSPSSLNCFENCPRQYYYRYIEKVPVESEGIEAFVGKRVHEVLERLYRFVDRDMLPALPRVLYRYHMLWEEHFDADRIRIVRREMDAEAYRTSGVRCIENYYRRYYPFDRDETLGVERAIQFKLDPDGHYPIRGIIDRLVRTREGVLEIHDFKTSRRIPRQEDLDRDRQLGLYELAIRREFDEPEIRLVWHFVMRNQTRVSVRSDEQRQTLREKTALAIDGIRAEQEWQAKTSGLCDWCEYKDRCPAFQDEVLPQEPREATAPQATTAPPAPAAESGESGDSTESGDSGDSGETGETGETQLTLFASGGHESRS